MTGILITVLSVIFVFGLLIIGHELGHFTVAKLSNIKVLEFSFGMGPRLIKFSGKETEYSLRAFPMGGFVKMLGEEEHVDDPRSFSCKPTLIKMLVIAAGPLMNIVISIIIFASIAISTGYIKPIINNFVKSNTSNIIYPAQESGLMIGDRIVKANDTKILSYEDFIIFMERNGSGAINITVKRNNQYKNIIITPVFDTNLNKYMIGIEPLYQKANFIEGFQYGYANTVLLAKELVSFFKGLFAGKVSNADVAGPVGIVKITGEAAKQGFGSLLFFTAFLSLNLAFMNLIPFPALDGGWLFILLIEGIRRKKLDADKIGILNFIGFAVLILLLIIVTFNDISKLKLF